MTGSEEGQFEGFESTCLQSVYCFVWWKDEISIQGMFCTYIMYQPTQQSKIHESVMIDNAKGAI